MESILGDQGRRSTKDLTKIVIREAGYFEGTGISGEGHKMWGPAQLGGIITCHDLNLLRLSD